MCFLEIYDINRETVCKMVRSVTETYLVILSPVKSLTYEPSALSNFYLHPLRFVGNEVRLQYYLTRPSSINILPVSIPPVHVNSLHYFSYPHPFRTLLTMPSQYCTNFSYMQSIHHYQQCIVRTQSHIYANVQSVYYFSTPVQLEHYISCPCPGPVHSKSYLSMCNQYTISPAHIQSVHYLSCFVLRVYHISYKYTISSVHVQ